MVIILSTSYCLMYMSNVHGCWGNPCDFYLESNCHTQILKASKGNVQTFESMFQCILSASLHALEQPPQVLKIQLFCISAGGVRGNFSLQLSNLTFFTTAPTKELPNKAVWNDLITACRQFVDINYIQMNVFLHTAFEQKTYQDTDNYQFHQTFVCHKTAELFNQMLSVTKKGLSGMAQCFTKKSDFSENLHGFTSSKIICFCVVKSKRH